MLSEIRTSAMGPYLDASPLFPPGVGAFVTLRGFEDVSPEGLARFLSLAGLPCRRVHRVNQVHSARAVGVEEAPCDADALVSTEIGEWVRVVTADCVPILMASEEGGAVAAVHAGWKGTLARIVEEAGRRLLEGRKPGAAYVGPAVHPCCYGVPEERVERFRRAFPGWVTGASGPPRLDLVDLNVRMLGGLGFTDPFIRIENRCTACGDGVCCSYRRDGERAGRMAALIGRTA
ncbi:MAG: polyphenol oxidase family protein [Acidobacteriota bacterium]